MFKLKPFEVSLQATKEKKVSFLVFSFSHIFLNIVHCSWFLILLPKSTTTNIQQLHREQLHHLTAHIAAPSIHSCIEPLPTTQWALQQSTFVSTYARPTVADLLPRNDQNTKSSRAPHSLNTTMPCSSPKRSFSILSLSSQFLSSLPQFRSLFQSLLVLP